MMTSLKYRVDHWLILLDEAVDNHPKIAISVVCILFLIVGVLSEGDHVSGF